MKPATIHTLDLNFMGAPGAIAAYLIPHTQGAILIESGPGSTQEALQAALRQHELRLTDITDVFLTHIHLDHAGAAGWLARHGARIHVHPVGAPHLRNPEKLLASAARIYGEMMAEMWGDFLPVPEDRLSVLQDGEVVEVGGLRVQAFDTPGHADHHYVYLFEDVCFSGDIGGVRPAGSRHLRLPMPPPEFNLEKWRLSLARLRSLGARRIAPTHFGIFDDPDWHLDAIARELDSIEAWIAANLSDSPTLEEVAERFLAWTGQRSQTEQVTLSQQQMFDAANPAWMSPAGIHRYWRKYRSPEAASKAN